MACYSQLWRQNWWIRVRYPSPPRGDVVICTNKGAFILVLCSEGTAQGLYVQSDIHSYHCSPLLSRIIKAAATCLLMVSLALLGNCFWKTQVAIVVAYVSLTTMFCFSNYWIEQRPEGLNEELWNITELFPTGVTNSHLSNRDLRASEVHPSLARTLWYMVKQTKNIGWIQRSRAAPNTPGWNAWLEEALKNMDNDNWPATAEYERIVLGNENVYDFPPEAEETTVQREASIEIRPVPASQW